MTTPDIFQDFYSETPLISNNVGTIQMVDDKEEILHLLNGDYAAALLPVSIFIGIEIILGFFGNLFVLYVFVFRYHDCNFR